MDLQQIPEFAMTVEGCAAAKAWLEETNQLHLLGRELSVDGYTLVALANSLKKRGDWSISDVYGVRIIR